MLHTSSQACQLLRGDSRMSDRPQVLLQLLHRGGAADDRRDPLLVQDPRQGELGQTLAVIGRDLLEPRHRVEVQVRPVFLVVPETLGPQAEPSPRERRLPLLVLARRGSRPPGG